MQYTQEHGLFIKVAFIGGLMNTPTEHRNPAVSVHNYTYVAAGHGVYILYIIM